MNQLNPRIERVGGTVPYLAIPQVYRFIDLTTTMISAGVLPQRAGYKS